jgi:hypothetical protein
VWLIHDNGTPKNVQDVSTGQQTTFAKIAPYLDAELILMVLVESTHFLSTWAILAIRSFKTPPRPVS